jgi:hypothetical protein
MPCGQATRRLAYDDPVEASYKLPFRFTGKIAELSCDCKFRASAQL